MPVHNFRPPRGRLEQLSVDSPALGGNLLGDPTRRTVAVYLPEGYDAADTPYPLIVVLAPFGSSGLRMPGWQPFGESLPQRLDRLISAGEMGPAVLAFPDCFTSLGGNQYVDSVALGRWETFVLEDLLPALEGRFRLRRGRHGRALVGRSSGGYGALLHGMRHADSWGAVACHSGDMHFDLAYRGEFPRALDRLGREPGGVAGFLEQVRRAQRVEGDDLHVLMTLALGASYDPDPREPCGARLPVDLRTCELIEERWEAWRRHDPLRMIEEPACQQGLASLRGLWIDCGSRDPYGLHYGARALVRRLERLGVRHVYEEFDDGHSGLDYRMDRSLPFLHRALETHAPV